jgi:hypothetical protein
MKIITKAYDDNGNLIISLENESVESLEEDLYKIEQKLDEVSEDYPIGGTVEPYDIAAEEELEKLTRDI